MRAGQQKGMGKNTGGGVVFKEVQHKKREANRKGDSPGTESVANKSQEELKVWGGAEQHVRGRVGGMEGGDTHRKDISYSPKLRLLNVVLLNEVRPEIPGLIHKQVWHEGQRHPAGHKPCSWVRDDALLVFYPFFLFYILCILYTDTWSFVASYCS